MAFTPASLIANINLGIGLLTGGGKLDTVGVYDQQSFRQVFPNARPMRATVRETSKVMEHPVETGAVLADHHIINPVDVYMQMIVNSQFYASTYQQIKSAFVNATLLTVQTRPTAYQNMIVADMPHEEEPEMFDIITITLHLREVLYVVPTSIAPRAEPENYSPVDPVQASTVKRGQQSPARPQTQIIDGRPMSVLVR